MPPHDNDASSLVEAGAAGVVGDLAHTDTAVDVQGPTLGPASGLSMAAPTLQRGDALGRYVVLEILGVGGMGTVYAAYDPRLDRRIALKILKHSGASDEGRHAGQARLLREAQALAKLHHPNIVAVYDVGDFEGQVHIAMEYIAGQDLRHWLRAADRSWQDIIAVFEKAGQALQAAHAMDVVHRDFKPENVMVSASGEVRVIDFGIARLYVESREPLEDDTIGAGSLDGIREVVASQIATEVGVALGTPAYMALEQFSGESDHRSDQFSFAVCLFEALYKVDPFGGNQILQRVENLRNEKLAQVASDTEVPSWLHQALLPALRANVADRYSSMHEFLERMRPPEQTVGDDDAHLLEIARAHHEGVGSKRRLMAGTAYALFVVAIIGVLYAINSGAITPYTPQRILLIAVVLWVGQGVVLFRWRSMFFANTYNRQWAQMLVGVTSALLVHRALAIIAATAPTEILQVDVFVLAVCALMSGYLSRWFYGLAGALGVMSWLSIVYPTLARIFMNGGGMLYAVCIWMIWSHKHREWRELLDDEA